MARSHDLDIRASADRITALFDSNQDEAALLLLQERWAAPTACDLGDNLYPKTASPRLPWSRA